MTVQNGLGAEEVVGAHGDWPLLSSVTFMSGTRHERHARRVHPRHGDVDRPVSRHDAGRCARRRRADRLVGPEGGGVRRPASRAVVEADLQRDGQRGRRVDRPAARLPLRRRAARRSRARPRRRGQGGGARRRRRAREDPVGDERARDAARARAPPVDARRRRGAPADRDRADHGRARARGEPRRSRRCRCTLRSTGWSRRRRRATPDEDLCGRLRRGGLALRRESRAAGRRRGVGVRRVA